VEPVTYLEWDSASLNELVALSKDQELMGVIRQLLQEADVDCCAATLVKDVQMSDLLSSAGEVLQCHAKRKGLAGCRHLAEGLQHIQSKDCAWQEKLDQSCMLITDSLDDVLKGTEALIDLVAACTALHAALMKPCSLDSFQVLELSPLFVPMSLVLLQLATQASRSSRAHGQKDVGVGSRSTD